MINQRKKVILNICGLQTFRNETKMSRTQHFFIRYEYADLASFIYVLFDKNKLLYLMIIFLLAYAIRWSFDFVSQFTSSPSEDSKGSINSLTGNSD